MRMYITRKDYKKMVFSYNGYLNKDLNKDQTKVHIYATTWCLIQYKKFQLAKMVISTMVERYRWLSARLW